MLSQKLRAFLSAIINSKRWLGKASLVMSP
uniref:Peptidyl-tRNA hydrolase n=1 Tax=Arundo donax TaxID=35708 RepID=A0A0A9GDP8_ARUDO